MSMSANKARRRAATERYMQHSFSAPPKPTPYAIPDNATLEERLLVGLMQRDAAVGAAGQRKADGQLGTWLGTVPDSHDPGAIMQRHTGHVVRSGPPGTPRMYRRKHQLTVAQGRPSRAGAKKTRSAPRPVPPSHGRGQDSRPKRTSTWDS